MNRHRLYRLPLIFISLLVFQAAAQAQLGQEARFSLESTVGNPGDIVEVPVFLEAGLIAPETCVLFINYDQAEVEPFEQYYEFVQTDLAGNPLRDAQGNTFTITSAVRPEASVVEAGKLVESQISNNEGYLSIAIVGINAEPLADGHLVTVAFRIKPGLGTSGTIPLDGDENFSSASAQQGQQSVVIPLAWEDGDITLGCAPPPAPAGVVATTNDPDAVTVRWDASPVEGAQYRVFRNTQINLSTAVPLGEGWQTETRFEDITARAPVVRTIPGCPKPLEVREISYFYWVQVRGEDGCISEFSVSPAEGARTLDKGFVAAGTASAGALLLYGAVAGLLLVTSKSRSKAQLARKRC